MTFVWQVEETFCSKKLKTFITRQCPKWSNPHWGPFLYYCYGSNYDNFVGQWLKVRKSRNYFFKLTFSPKKNEWILLYYYANTMKPQVDLFSFVFLRKLKTPKRHFEINWPLWKVVFYENECSLKTSLPFGTKNHEMQGPLVKS